MKSPEQIQVDVPGEPVDSPETAFQALQQPNEDEILAAFTPEQQTEILNKQRILSSLAYFIGKDFKISVELNEHGKGWHWDFKDNIIRIDPKDLLEKPLDYLRFVISHEGGHRRISRTSFIPLEVWQQKGFSFLMNAIEDPRDNNFVAANYPRFAEQMKLAYEMNFEEEKMMKQKAKDRLGYQPRFMQAGFEYIKLWFNEKMKKPAEISTDLQEEIKEIVKKTITSASDAWKTYPTKNEADNGGVIPGGEKVDGEGMISEYAKQSYEIIFEEIWPEYKKLVEQDLEDQKMAELLNDFEQKKQEQKDGKDDGNIPKELKDKLTPEEQKELEDAIGKAVDMDSLSPALKKKIKDFIDSLPEEKKKELVERAEKTLRDFEDEISKEIGGKLSENPEEKQERENVEKAEIEKKKKENSGETSVEIENQKQEKLRAESKKMLEKVRKSLEGTTDEYQKEMKRLTPQINSLKEKLAEIFQERRKRGIRTGFDEGEEIDVERRLQEKAKGISIFESKAWRRTELPREKDYAISLLVDLSGSMRGEKIGEAFEATILFTEVLNSLGIKMEIIGFNDRLYEYQKFSERFSNDVRKKIITMKKQVSLSGCEKNDDGWAVAETSKRLEARKEKEKLLIVVSDGEPDNSPEHDGPQYELGSVVKGIMDKGKVKIVGLGLGSSGVSAVKHYYPKHLLAESAEEMIKEIGDLLLEVIKG